MKKWIAALVVTFGLVNSGASSAQAEDLKIGFVDMQKALQTVEAGKKAKAQLEKEFNAKKKDLQTEESAIRKMGEEFKKQALVMNEEARAKKQGEIQERVLKLQEMQARSQMELQQKEQQLTQPIVVKLRTIVSELAKQKNYNAILEKNENTVLFSQEKDDLTTEVISRYNSSAAKTSS